MQKAVEQFMEEFFQERARVHPVLNPQRYAILPERVEEVEDFGDRVRVLTRIQKEGETEYIRHRYELRPEGESWTVASMAYQCGRCRGTGKDLKTAELCVRCKGNGWVIT